MERKFTFAKKILTENIRSMREEGSTVPRDSSPGHVTAGQESSATHLGGPPK